MMVGLYLTLPVIKVIAKDRDTTRYMIWLLLIFAAVFGTVEGVTGFLKMMAAENYGYSLWTAFLSDLDNLNMTFVPGYLGFFLMGNIFMNTALADGISRLSMVLSRRFCFQVC